MIIEILLIEEYVQFIGNLIIFISITKKIKYKYDLLFFYLINLFIYFIYNVLVLLS
jgi:hypothetical protein